LTRADEPQAYLERVAALCQTRPFVEAVALLMAERTDSFRSVLHTKGADGLTALANEIAVPLSQVAPADLAVASVAGQCGFLLGYASASLEKGAHGNVGAHDRAVVH